VTDDEAFVRAIVAAPGDDAPRLVYADWLDERGDPRGDYLRAELDWARPWGCLECPPASRELPKMAGKLDPLWVFRVSRPPLGVCCDHITLQKGGPAVTATELDAVESRLGLTLPLDLRAFLLNRNGGVPEPGWYFPKGAARQRFPSFVSVFIRHQTIPTCPRESVGRSYSRWNGLTWSDILTCCTCMTTRSRTSTRTFARG
jgi:uncharacterized protein (TIGR02996 family)